MKNKYSFRQKIYFVLFIPVIVFNIYDLFFKDYIEKSLKETYSSFLDDYKNKNYAQAKKKSLQILSKVDLFSDRWWYGNYVHCTHSTLGKIALIEGNVEESKKHFLKSISQEYIDKAGGDGLSPQIDSYGPDGVLSMFLFHIGEVNVVFDYYKQTKKFWNSNSARHYKDLIEVYGYMMSFGEKGKSRAKIPYHFKEDCSFKTQEGATQEEYDSELLNLWVTNFDTVKSLLTKYKDHRPAKNSSK